MQTPRSTALPPGAVPADPAQRPGAPRFTRAGVADVAPGALTPLSVTAGPASVLLGHVCAGIAVVTHAGHLYLDRPPPEPAAEPGPDTGPELTDPGPGSPGPCPGLPDLSRPACPVLPDTATERAADRVAGRAREVRPDLRRCPDGELAERVLALRAPLETVVPLLVTAQRALDHAARRSPPHRTGGPAPELDPADQLWELAGVVARSDTLNTLFDEGGPDLAPRLAASRVPDVVAFRQGLVATLAEFAHVSDGGWELAVPGWLHAPADLLRILEVLRRAPDAATRRRARAADLVDPPAVAAAAAARQRAAQRVDLIAHEQRLLVHELGRRAEAAGALVDAADVFGLTVDELPAFAADPHRHTDALRLRGYDHRAVTELVAPAQGDEPPPSPVRWRRAGSSPALGAGETLAGVGAAPGRASGPAAVLATPADAEGLEPGCVLVVGTGGTFWVPLLRAVAALVVDAGAVTSPAAAACRRLGVPCVVAATGATERVGAGGGLTVDGDRGVLSG
ncbi:MAG: PEP-utilizing enzyme [Pseudonocardia sp.]